MAVKATVRYQDYTIPLLHGGSIGGIKEGGPLWHISEILGAYHSWQWWRVNECFDHYHQHTSPLYWHVLIRSSCFFTNYIASTLIPCHQTVCFLHTVLGGTQDLLWTLCLSKIQFIIILQLGHECVNTATSYTA